MKQIVLFLFILPAFAISAQTLTTAKIDTIDVIDGKIYEVKTWNEYQIVNDTMAFHARILVINDEIAELNREKRVLASKIAFFESNKSEFMRAQKQPVKTKKPAKQPATKPKKSGN